MASTSRPELIAAGLAPCYQPAHFAVPISERNRQQNDVGHEQRRIDRAECNMNWPEREGQTEHAVVPWQNKQRTEYRSAPVFRARAEYLCGVPAPQLLAQDHAEEERRRNQREAHWNEQIPGVG